jgi:hypothetical protein
MEHYLHNTVCFHVVILITSVSGFRGSRLQFVYLLFDNISRSHLLMSKILVGPRIRNFSECLMLMCLSPLFFGGGCCY